MSEYEIRPVEWLVCEKGKAVFEANVRIRIEDEAGGEYIQVDSLDENGKINIEPNEWPTVRAAIDHAVSLCRDPAETDGDGDE